MTKSDFAVIGQPLPIRLDHTWCVSLVKHSRYGRFLVGGETV